MEAFYKLSQSADTLFNAECSLSHHFLHRLIDKTKISKSKANTENCSVINSQLQLLPEINLNIFFLEQS